MHHNTSHTKTVPKAEARPPMVFLGFVLLGIFTLIILGWLGFGVFAEAWPGVPAEKPKFTLEGLRNYFWSVGMVAAGLVALWGFALAAVRTHALDRQAKTAEHESILNAKKHESEAFAMAIEQLGHDKFAVRLGAVYALEALAKASKSLHGPIFETLCAYVKETAPAPKVSGLAKAIETRGNTSHYGAVRKYLATINKPNVVVQAILTVIGRRSTKHDPDTYHLDLQDTDLRKADLHHGDYDKINLNRAHLEGANLSSAQLENAILFAAHLEGANLAYAELRSADLDFSHLEGAILLHAGLEDTQLSSANLNGANLYKANLKNTRLDRAYLEGTNLSRARLENTYIKGILFNNKTRVSFTNFSTTRAIPAQPENDFRVTAVGSDKAIWPDVDDPNAWDRGDEDDLPS